jgi:hypothetical protein
MCRYIVHTCIQNAIILLPFVIEAPLVKMSKHLFLYTVHVPQLKEFCDFVDSYS